MIGSTAIIASAMSGAAPPPPASAPPVQVGFYTFEPDASVYTLDDVPLLTPTSNRYVMVSLDTLSTGSTSTTSVTIDGTPMNVEWQDAAGNRDCACFTLNWPLGSTADIVINRSGTTNRAGFEVSVFYSSAGSRSARTGSSSTTGSSVNLLALPAITVPSGGWAYAVGWVGATGTATWSQTTGTGTKMSDADVGTTGLRMSTYTTTTSGSQTFTIDAGDATNYRGAALTWAA